jgi:hypothetical protein
MTDTDEELMGKAAENIAKQEINLRKAKKELYKEKKKKVAALFEQKRIIDRDYGRETRAKEKEIKKQNKIGVGLLGKPAYDALKQKIMLELGIPFTVPKKRKKQEDINNSYNENNDKGDQPNVEESNDNE